MTFRQFRYWLAERFATLDKLCDASPYADQRAIAKLVDEAFRKACRYGFPEPISERPRLTPRVGLQRLGVLLAWADRRAKRWRLTPAEAAAKLGVSAGLVRRWIKSGELEAIRVGRVYRIAPEALEAFEATCRV